MISNPVNHQNVSVIEYKKHKLINPEKNFFFLIKDTQLFHQLIFQENKILTVSFFCLFWYSCV